MRFILLFIKELYKHLCSKIYLLLKIKLHFIFTLLCFHVLLVEYFIIFLFMYVVVTNYETRCEKAEIKSEL